MQFRFLFICLIALIFTSCNSANIKEANELETYFNQHKVKGTFAIFNNGQGNFNIYNISRYKDSAYTPASTFKIVNTLIGLQTGVIANTQAIAKWDGVVRNNFPNWNRDLSFDSAFYYSCVPCYQEVARKIGATTMQQWLDSLSYGKAKITNKNIDSFWLNNDIKIKPDEQLGLVKKLYFNQLPFSKTTMEAVKRIMVQENNSNYTLAYKTGWGNTENGNNIGWVVGWIEENKHPHFFVLNIESTDKNVDIVSTRKEILYQCLNHLGYLKGKQ